MEKITRSQLWKLKAYQFKMLMFFQFVDSNIDLDDFEEVKSLCDYIKVPPKLFFDGIDFFYRNSLISFNDDGFIVVEVKVESE